VSCKPSARVPAPVVDRFSRGRKVLLSAAKKNNPSRKLTADSLRLTASGVEREEDAGKAVRSR